MIDFRKRYNLGKNYWKEVIVFTDNYPRVLTITAYPDGTYHYDMAEYWLSPILPTQYDDYEIRQLLDDKRLESLAFGEDDDEFFWQHP